MFADWAAENVAGHPNNCDVFVYMYLTLRGPHSARRARTQAAHFALRASRHSKMGSSIKAMSCEMMKAVSQEGTPRRSRLTTESCVCVCVCGWMDGCLSAIVIIWICEREMRVLLRRYRASKRSIAALYAGCSVENASLANPAQLRGPNNYAQSQNCPRSSTLRPWIQTHFLSAICKIFDCNFGKLTLNNDLTCLRLTQYQNPKHSQGQKLLQTLI